MASKAPPRELDIDALVEDQQTRSYAKLPRTKFYRDLSTVIVTPVRGEVSRLGETECPHCGELVEYTQSTMTGFSPIVLESWKRMIRPMNHPVYDVVLSGHEVGEAYDLAVDAILQHDVLSKCKFILFLEDDIVIPSMPGTRGPLFALFDRIADGYDVANGLYYLKTDVSFPLIFGDPQQGTDNFECITAGWEPGDVVECNGAGMGFSLWRMDIFRDKRFERPFFKTLQEIGVGAMTQDLYAYRKIRALGYRVCVDTSVRCGHFNSADGEVY